MHLPGILPIRDHKEIRSHPFGITLHRTAGAGKAPVVECLGVYSVCLRSRILPLNPNRKDQPCRLLIDIYSHYRLDIYLASIAPLRAARRKVAHIPPRSVRLALPPCIRQTGIIILLQSQGPSSASTTQHASHIQGIALSLLHIPITAGLFEAMRLSHPLQEACNMSPLSVSNAQGQGDPPARPMPLT